MTPRVAIDDQTLHQLQEEGELRVETAAGVPLVVMTVDAREDLQKAIYDDSALSEAEMRAAGRDQLDDPEGWGAPGMEIYDKLYGDDPTDHGKDQKR
jgi:hypothetical protein